MFEICKNFSPKLFVLLLALLGLSDANSFAQEQQKAPWVEGLQCIKEKGMVDGDVANMFEAATKDNVAVQAEIIRLQVINEMKLGLQAPEQIYRREKQEDGSFKDIYAFPKIDQSLWQKDNRAKQKPVIAKICRSQISGLQVVNKPEDKLIQWCRDAFFKRLEMAEEFLEKHPTQIAAVQNKMKEGQTALEAVAGQSFEAMGGAWRTAMDWGHGLFVGRRRLGRSIERGGREVGHMIRFHIEGTDRDEEYFAAKVFNRPGAWLNPLYFTSGGVVEHDQYNAAFGVSGR